MKNNNFRLPPNSGNSNHRPISKSRYKKDMRKKRIATVIVLFVTVTAIVATIVTVKGHKSNPTLSESVKSSESATTSTRENNTSATENGEGITATGEMDIEFTDADEDYAETHKYCVGVNRKQNVVTVYEKDESGKYTKPIKAFLCSCGKTDGNETPAGTFKTSDKVRWLSLVDNTYGQYTTRVDGHIWFHSVPYYDKDPSQLETEEFNKLGQNASLGCIRLSVADVKWLYDNLDWQTIVIVYDSDNPGPLGKPEGIKIDLNSENKGWDPTDTDENNPWN